MASRMERPMANHVLVAFSFTLLAMSVALRDSEKSNSLVGIGHTGQSWHLAHDTPDSKTDIETGESVQRNELAMNFLKSLQTDTDSDAIDNGSSSNNVTEDGNTVSQSDASDVETGANNAGSIDVEEDSAQDEASSTGNVRGNSDQNETASTGDVEQDSSNISPKETSTSGDSGQDGKKTNKTNSSTSDAAGQEKPTPTPGAKNGSTSKPSGNSTETPYDIEEEFWDYNPFRFYAKGTDEERTKDLDCPDGESCVCPKPEVFIDTVTTIPHGVRHLCMLRYILLHVCKLPETVCTSCACDPNPTKEPAYQGVCPLDLCFKKIPVLWVQAYIFPTVLIIASHVVASPVFEFVMDYVMRVPLISRFILKYIGTRDKAPQIPGFRIYLLVIQIAASMATVLFFCMMDMAEAPRYPWTNSGNLRNSWLGWFQFIMNIQMLVNYYVTWFKLGFRWDGVLTANMLIDAATVHRTLFRQFQYDPLKDKIASNWSMDAEAEFLFLSRPKMNLHFLRAYRCLTALLEMQDMGALNWFKPIKRQMIKTSLRLFALVMMFSGTMTLLEWFGHDLSLDFDDTANIGECKNQSNLKDNIACVPFMVGIYWVFTTISTVGYGDLTPHSAGSYALVVIMIVGGVTFFSLESSTIVEVTSLENNGLAPCIKPRDHVVVSGGAMRDVDPHVLGHFISQILHKAVIDQGGEWPFLCLLGKVQSSSDVTRFLDTKMSTEMKKYIQFCNADPLTPEGLIQAKVDTASIVYILPSSTTDDYSREDEYNIHVTLSVKAACKASKVKEIVPFRLVLFKPSSLELAIMSGIHPGQCLCLDQLRTAIMAQATEVRGWPCLLMSLTSNAAYDSAKFNDFCKQSLFPEGYGDTCSNSLFGFAVSKNVAGLPFHELANLIYKETGALLVCAQIDGKVRDFPWEVVVAPDTIAFAIHNTDIELSPSCRRFCAQVDWRTLFLKNRARAFKGQTWSEEHARALAFYIQAPPATLSEEVLSEEELDAHRLKAEEIKNGKDDFVLVVMTAVESYWQLLAMYIEKLPITGEVRSKKPGKKELSAIALVSEAPPKNIVEHLTGTHSKDMQLAFVVGDWMQPEVIRAAGAEQAKVIVTFEVNSLRATPANDTRTFFLLRLMARMHLRPECVVLSELTSGMSGAHMIPLPRSMAEQGELLPKQPKDLEEDVFNTSCSAGQVFIPRSLLGLVAKSYYTFGIVEAVQNVTQDHDEDISKAVNPVQITIPDELQGHAKSYGDVVSAFLSGKVGPHPAVCIGILRETLYSEAVMLHPPFHYRLTKADLLIVLASGFWIDWAQDEGLRCFGGRFKRTANGS